MSAQRCSGSLTGRFLSAAFVVVFWGSCATWVVGLLAGLIVHNFLDGAPTYRLALFSFAVWFISFFAYACSSLAPSAAPPRPAWPMRVIYWLSVVMIWAGTIAAVVTMCFSWYALLLHSEETRVIAGRVIRIQGSPPSVWYTFMLEGEEMTGWCEPSTGPGSAFEVGDSINIRYVPHLPRINCWVGENINEPMPSVSSPLAAFVAASARYTTAGLILLFLLTMLDGRNAGYLFEFVMRAEMGSE